VRRSFKRTEARADLLRGVFILVRDNLAGRTRIARNRHGVPCPYKASQREREDDQIALAGEHYGQEAAVGRDIEFANRNAAEDWLRRGCEDGHVLAGFLRGKLGNIYPDDVAGFSFDGAFQHDAIFVGGPMETAEAHAEADEVIRSGEVADLQNFSVDEVRHFFAAGGNREAAGVAIERGDFLVVLCEEFKALEARRSGLRAVLFDGDGGVCARDAIGVDEGAAFEGGTRRAGRDIGVAEREEHTRLDLFVEVDDGRIVLQPCGVEAVLDEVFAFAEADFLAAVFEREGLEGVFGAALVDDAGGEKLGENEAAVGRPAKGVDGVGKEFFTAVELISLEKAAALAVGFLKPDVVVLEIVFFGFDISADGIDDAAVGREAEGGDFFVDVLERFVEVLSAGLRHEKTAKNEKDQNV
jgi:hypothetical protein